MKRFLKPLILIIATTFSINVMAQSIPVPSESETPTLDYVMTLSVNLGEAYSVGRTSFGSRNVIPITGGTFQGPNIKGTIIPGGADWQLSDSESGRTTLEAIYAIRTDDGVNIHVRNVGIIANGKDANGNPTFYFRAAPKFEAPIDSKYAWLNNALFVCAPNFSGPQGTITLHVWMVK